MFSFLSLPFEARTCSSQSCNQNSLVVPYDGNFPRSPVAPPTGWSKRYRWFSVGDIESGSIAGKKRIDDKGLGVHRHLASDIAIADVDRVQFATLWNAMVEHAHRNAGDRDTPVSLGVRARKQEVMGT